jgi:class 3 adenylate cyclase
VQEREAIVYFSDIANFSSWATGRLPVEVGRLARLLASAQIELIRDAGGTVDKVMGDGIMAYWFVDTRERARNVPCAVIECARTAIENLRAIIAREGLDELDVRIGLHTGPVAFGDFGATDRIAVTIFGETVNLAARFEQAKSPGLRALRISPELKTLAENAGAALPGLAGPSAVEVKHGLSLEIFSI